jgi:hypothetical protein
MEATSAAIRAVEAEGLLGVGIKLAARPVGFEPDPEHLEEARDAVLMDIERLLGITVEEAVSIPILTVVPDPIFAAIEDHQAKFEAVRALTSHDDNSRPEPASGDPPELVAALAASIVARKTLVSTLPTTLAGVVAVLSYVHDQPGWPNAFLFDKAESRRFIRSLELATRKLATTQSIFVSPTARSKIRS